MPVEPWDKEQHNLYAERIEEHLHRVDKRLELLEGSVKAINELALSVERLAGNMQSLSETQSDMKKKLDSISERDGEKWRKAMWFIGTAIAGAIIGYVIKSIGIV